MKIYKILADAHREDGDTDAHRLKALNFLALVFKSVFWYNNFTIEVYVFGLHWESHSVALFLLPKWPDIRKNAPEGNSGAFLMLVFSLLLT